MVERKTSGYILTPAGEELKISACRIEQELLSFEGRVGGQDDDVAGELRVTAIANMASTVLMPYFARFVAVHPNIELNVLVTNNSVRLTEREADIALRQTNKPGENLIGTQLTTVASAVYGGEIAALTSTQVNPPKSGLASIAVSTTEHGPSRLGQAKNTSFMWMKHH